jgi:hypothetical protein
MQGDGLQMHSGSKDSNMWHPASSCHHHPYWQKMPLGINTTMMLCATSSSSQAPTCIAVQLALLLLDAAVGGGDAVPRRGQVRLQPLHLAP